MFKNRIEIIEGILIIILCLIVLIITIYLLYHYRKKKNFLHQNLNDEQFKKDNSNFNQINKSEEEKEINDSLKINNIETTVIGELMKKSLQLAKTAEQVADHNQKRYSLKDNIRLHL